MNISTVIGSKYFRFSIIFIGAIGLLLLVYCIGRPLFAVRGQYQTIEEFFSENDEIHTGEGWFHTYPLCGPFRVRDDMRNPFNGVVLDVDDSRADVCCEMSAYTVYKDPDGRIFWVHKQQSGIGGVTDRDEMYGPYEYETDEIGEEGGGEELSSSGLSQESYSQLFLKEYHYCTLEVGEDETAVMTVYDENGVVLDTLQVDTDDGFVQRGLF